MNRILLAAFGAICAQRSLLALPTMIRLGYPNCASCHVAPQGGGMLNEYGRGIDDAQSLRPREYEPRTRRLDQDFRLVLSDSTSQPAKARLYYRSIFRLRESLRFTATVSGDNSPSPRAHAAAALVQYRPKEGMELAAGIDQLPMGVYTGDLSTFVKSRNRAGFHDTPVQAKLTLWRKRWQAVPYAFGASAERGGGVLAEIDVLGKGNTVAGINLLRAEGQPTNRGMAGLYGRLGFGRWGILAEHDWTRRSFALASQKSFGQSASYGQTFYAFREWLVGSAIVERLAVANPFAESLVATRGELSARLSPMLTLGLRAGVQFDRRAGTAAPVLTLAVAWKTVHMRPWRRP